MNEPLLVANNLWRGPRPPSFEWLKERGFNVVIDLEWGWRDFFTDSEYERARNRTALKDVGSEYRSDYGTWFYSIPCSDFTPPSFLQVQEFLGIASNLGKHKAYVHCLSGVDRTGFMCAVYKMKNMVLPWPQAYVEWIALGRHWWYWWWKYELKKWWNVYKT